MTTGARIAKPFLALILSAVFASGCIRHPIYHESWAEQVKVEDGACPDIDGEYENTGEAFKKDKHIVYQREQLSLAHLLNGGYGMETYTVDNRLGFTAYQADVDPHRQVRLKLDGDVLHVESTLDDGRVQAFDLPVRRACRDSIVVLEAAWSYELFTASAARGYYAFGRAEDGSLLAYGNVGGVLLGVFWNSAAFWVRFPTVASGPPQLSELAP
jgi:hypothetical protein